MLKDILSLADAKILSKKEQKTVAGGFSIITTCQFEPECEPGFRSINCICVNCAENNIPPYQCNSYNFRDF
ncbi:hypothetical protein GTQ40_09480 [Flavobacteriaceae bacterium R38]|nr:hypothetical protein [Flavobacteriaceae bacterium R38]